MDEWRTTYADLLVEEDIEFDIPRKDTPDYAEMDATVTDKGERLGEVEKRQMGQVHIVRNAGSLREIPVWFNNETAVKHFLLINFPYLNHDFDQQRVAAKWYHIIHRWRAHIAATRTA
jgi:hypothetical protein